MSKDLKLIWILSAVLLLSCGLFLTWNAQGNVGFYSAASGEKIGRVATDCICGGRVHYVVSDNYE